MRGERQLKRDYDAIHYIQRQLSGFEDKKMVFAMTKAFNKMCAAEEPDGCLSTTVELFIALKYLGYKPRICYGLVVPPSGYEFYHAWLELDGKIVDIAIYGNAKFSPFSTFDVRFPIVMGSYEANEQGMEYRPFTFDEDWRDALISKVQGMPVVEYCDKSPKRILWKFACDLLDMSPLKANVDALRDTVKDEVI